MKFLSAVSKSANAAGALSISRKQFEQQIA
jgi:hypothetical protein